MQVHLHSPRSWYLLKDGTSYYLDVNCEQSAASFTLLIMLTPEEYTEYHDTGRVYLDYLAARVNYHSRQYFARNVQGEVAQAAQEAIRAWQRAQSAAPKK